MELEMRINAVRCNLMNLERITTNILERVQQSIEHLDNKETKEALMILLEINRDIIAVGNFHGAAQELLRQR